jgi:hypothetical protein
MNTDKTNKEGFSLSVFIGVHRWLNLFVRGGGSVRFPGGSKKCRMTSGVQSLYRVGLRFPCESPMASSSLA